MRELQTTVMSFGDPTADRKAESCAAPITLRARPHFIRAKEALENARLEFYGDALPRVADSQGILRIFVSAGDRNDPPLAVYLIALPKRFMIRRRSNASSAQIGISLGASQ